ncbi:extracellular solute-binding protein [Thermosphaera chiliense]|uniref:Extracellular solute-binding protein n=1 Tax=Thermosphaera chiliense TaxID=3402707 RepID=A0A7M1UQS0_9CREN|nr:extracellular solute-binding protein [Thermosphaera aggregans]QOR94541.1 extracellular solute-binding protein [Thermosphaera aggregans]
MSKALTKIQAVIIVLIVAVAAIAGAYLISQQIGAQQTTTTQTTTPTTTPTGTETTTTPTGTGTTTPPPAGNVILIGDLSITVPANFKAFVDAAKDGSISVTIYFGHALSQDEFNAFQQVIDMFKQEYPGINVVPIPYSSMDALKTQISAIAALPPEQRESFIGQAPDVFTWAHDWIGSFADKGWILDLETFIGTEAIINDIAPAIQPLAMSAVTYKLKTYGLPYAGEAIALIVNKQLVPNPPTTFDEMKNIMQQFHNPSAGKYGLSYQFDPYHLYPFITAFGGYYYDEETGSVGVNSTGTKDGVKFYIQNVLPYLDTSDLGFNNQLNNFLTGKTPMIITGPWALPSIKNAIGLNNIEVVPIPNIGNNVPKPFSGFRNLYLTILANSGGVQRTYASVLFILYMALNDNALKILVEQNGYVPVKQSVIQYVVNNKSQYPVVYGFMQQVLRSSPMPKDPKMDKVWGIGTNLNAIIGEYTNALAEGKTVEEAIQAAIAVVDPQLDEAYATIMQSMGR